MNDLRLVLLGVGVVVIAAVWLWSLYARRRNRRARIRSGVTEVRGVGRQRAETRGSGRGKRTAPLRPRRGEHLALDLPLDPEVEDQDPGMPPLGLDPLEDDVEEESRNLAFSRDPTRVSGVGDEGIDSGDARHGTSGRETISHRSKCPKRSRGGKRVPLAGADSDDPAGSAGPDSPAGGWDADGLEGLRATRDEPEQLDMDTFDADPDEALPTAEESDPERSAADEPGEETMVVILTVLAPQGERLEGAALRAAFDAQGLRHGEDRIFHRYPDAAPASVGPLFSAVNIVEPGVFDLETMDSMYTPGVGLFMRLPGPNDPGDAFEVMVDVARELANALDAQLCDETRSKLTVQALNHLREQIADFGRRRLLRV